MLLGCTYNFAICLTDCVVTGDWSHLTPFSTRKLKADTEIKSRRGADHPRGIRGCWWVLLYFAPYQDDTHDTLGSSRD